MPNIRWSRVGFRSYAHSGRTIGGMLIMERVDRRRQIDITDRGAGKQRRAIKKRGDFACIRTETELHCTEHHV